MIRAAGVRRAAAHLAPMRVRLVAGFAVTMALVLVGAGGFVWVRVRYALDLSLHEELARQSAVLVGLAGRPDRDQELTLNTSYYQLLDATGRPVGTGGGLPGGSVVPPALLASARVRTTVWEDGGAWPIRPGRLRFQAGPVPVTGTADGRPAVAVVAVPLDHRDEALRELFAQLLLANLAALALGSVISYRLAGAALAPVERYRRRAAEIATGATGLRLEVPTGRSDEISRLGETLNDMLAALEAALARERRLIDDAGHELRTPLTLLSAELELALRSPRDADELRRALIAAAGDTAHLIRLTNDLLDAAPGPPVTAELQIVDLGRMAATAPVLVRADPRRVEQILANLLQNARVHGAGATTVTAAEAGRAGLLLVSDEGPGMAAEFLPHAVERFRRADPARHSPGHGLGLSIVAALVEAQSGELRICSRGAHHRVHDRFEVDCTHQAVGTTVTVVLPLHRRQGG